MRARVGHGHRHFRSYHSVMDHARPDFRVVMVGRDATGRGMPVPNGIGIVLNMKRERREWSRVRHFGVGGVSVVAVAEFTVF